jgi:alpha-tubulin suppressor-like RCC1 family protein
VTFGRVAYCWGDNTYGALGNGSAAVRSLIPVAISGGLSFAAVSANAFFACGVTTSGAAYCWGEGSNGQLGNGSNTSTDTPVAVSGGLVFASVSAGFQTACGVTTAGAAYCWGNNNYGELGNGSTAAFSLTPVAVSGGLAFAAVTAAGYFRTCGLTTSGTAYCWGHEVRSTGDGNSNTPLAVSGGLTF